VHLYNGNNIYKDISLIQKGDIVFFHTQSKKESKPTPKNKYPGHVGIYLGNNMFIQAKPSLEEVVIRDITKKLT